jgi:hypothetical protein
MLTRLYGNFVLNKLGIVSSCSNSHAAVLAVVEPRCAVGVGQSHWIGAFADQ